MHFAKAIQILKNRFPDENQIFLHEPCFIGNEKQYLTDAIDSTFVSSVGPYVDRFEQEMAAFTRSKKAVAVVNGTAAIQVSLRLVGVRPGDEVLTQALTFVATTNAIIYNQASPVFLDVDLDTMGMSPEALRSFLNTHAERREDGCYNKETNKRIAACLPMHTFGFMCRIDEISKICIEWQIALVEDGAEALGSLYKGQPPTTHSSIATFSFNGNKIITSGGGGIIATNEQELGDKAKYLTTTAKKPHPWAYEHDELGYNYRMPNINAALACAQLEQLDLLKDKKKALYNEYREHLDLKGIKLKEVPKDTDWNYWLISVELENERDKLLFLKETNQNGVMTRPIWNLMYRLPMYQHCQRDSQVNAEYLEARIVNIPSSAKLPINS